MIDLDLVPDTETLWREYRTRLRAFVASRVSDPDAADDMVQDIFLKAHTRLLSLRDPGRIESWLYQIARNAIVDYYRRSRADTAIPEWTQQAESDASDRARQELADCLVPMIACLPEHYRDAVSLSALKGWSQSDIAAYEGISLSGAKSRVQRGRAMLKDMLLDCCHVQLSHTGRVMDFECKTEPCDACSDGAEPLLSIGQ